MSKSRPKVGLLRNYRPDGQYSMELYGRLCHQALSAAETGLQIVTTRPTSLLGNLPLPVGRMRKAARNLDKFILSPPLFAGRRYDLLHITDHANAVYESVLRRRRLIITCHDMIPFLVAAGRLEGPGSTPTGKWLLKRIIRGLEMADAVVCISENTRQDLLSLSNLDPERVHAIPMPLPPGIQRMAEPQARSLLTASGVDPDAPFVLHVGASLFYKNRENVIRIFAAAAKRVSEPVNLVLVGALSPPEANLVAASSAKERIVVLSDIGTPVLNALYSTATALLFPSLYEGFGWPVIEAQTCGAIVITSDRGSLPEVVGSGGVTIPIEHEEQMVEALARAITDQAWRAEMVARGLENCKRFEIDLWLKAMSRIYQSLL